VIVKDVAGDDNEVHLELSSLFPKLLQRGESCLSDPVAGILFKPRDPQTQVKIRGMKETNHNSAFPCCQDQLHDVVLIPF
jgi:hypothetical protein